MKIDRAISTQVLFPILFNYLENGQKVEFTISGCSMWPFLCPNRDQVILEAVDEADLHVGDIVLFVRDDNNYMLHRITKLTDGYFETTGDGNCFRDGLFPVTSIKGRVSAMKRKGKLINCKNIIWKCVFEVWMRCFPVRKILLKVLKAISKL